jgi:hypothetical protein
MKHNLHQDQHFADVPTTEYQLNNLNNQPKKLLKAKNGKTLRPLTFGKLKQT